MAFKFTTTIPEGLKRYKAKLDLEGKGGVDFQARTQTAKQFLNWSNQGSGNDSTVPPIKTGNLRGSASVFVGDVMVQDTRGKIGTPLRTYSGKKGNVSIIYNTAYAARMHEDSWEAGSVSQQSGDVGNKWLEKHMKADGKDLMQMYANLIKQGMAGA